MATKKQKRAAAEARREEFMAKYRADGLAALKADQERRKKLSGLYAIEARKINDHHRRVLIANGIDPDTGLHREVAKQYDVPFFAAVEELRDKVLGRWDDQPPLNMEDYIKRDNANTEEGVELHVPFSHLTKSGT